MSTNGNLQPSELTIVDGWAELTPDTAAAYSAVKAYILAHFFIALVITAVDGAYRSLARQVAVKAQFGILAATPGTSNHGWGTAFDIFNIDAVLRAVGGGAALDAILARFGLVRDAPDGRGGIESWHCHLVAIVNLSAMAGATDLHIPIALPEEGAPVSTVYFKGDQSGAVFALNKDTGKKRNVSASEYAVVASASAGTQPNFGAMSGGGLIIVAQASADAIPAE